MRGVSLAKDISNFERAFLEVLYPFSFIPQYQQREAHP